MLDRHRAVRVCCYIDPLSPRSMSVGKAMAAGAARHGERVVVSDNWNDTTVRADVAVGYGQRAPELFAAYRAAGHHFVYIDLGYWDRKPLHDYLAGCHKVVVDARDPNAYLMQRGHEGRRFKALGLRVRPWRTTGTHIVLAGMSAKAARTSGYGYLEFERATATMLRALTDRPIVYRPKPSGNDRTDIKGTRICPTTMTLDDCLADAWAVVTYRSNVGVDALVAGIPIYTVEGAARLLSMPSLDLIRDPPLPDNRSAFMSALAWAQWTPEEMATGACWAWLRGNTPLCG
jgi:hypothetical protein